MYFTEMLNALSQLALAAVAFWIFWTATKKSSRNLALPLGAYAFASLLIAAISLFWSSTSSNVAWSEKLLLLGVITSIRSLVFLVIVYMLIKRKLLLTVALLYLLALFAIPLTSANYAMSNMVLSVFPQAICLVLLAMDGRPALRLAGFVGMVAVFLEVLGIAAVQVGVFSTAKPVFVSAALMAFVMYRLGTYIASDYRSEPVGHPSRAMAASVAKFLVLILAVMPFLLFTTITIHELGHAMAAKAAQCDIQQIIIYDYQNYPHTQADCPPGANEQLFLAGGFVFTLIIALLFMLTGIRVLTAFSLIIAAFDIFLSYNDLVRLKATLSVFILLLMCMLVLIGAGVMRLATAFIDEDMTYSRG